MAYRCDVSILGLDAGVIVLMAPDAEKLGFPLIVWKTHDGYAGAGAADRRMDMLLRKR